MSIVDYINGNNGFLMVLITFLYVVTTIGIFCANHTSAKAANQQIQEMRRQYDETSRLECLPYFRLDFTSDTPEDPVAFPPDNVNRYLSSWRSDSNGSIMTLMNVGNGTATNIKYSFSINDRPKSDSCSLINAIMKESSYCFKAFFPRVNENEMIDHGVIELEFDDFLGNHYLQSIPLLFYVSDNAQYNIRIDDILNPVLCD